MHPSERGSAEMQMCALPQPAAPTWRDTLHCVSSLCAHSAWASLGGGWMGTLSLCCTHHSHPDQKLPSCFNQTVNRGSYLSRDSPNEMLKDDKTEADTSSMQLCLVLLLDRLHRWGLLRLVPPFTCRSANLTSQTLHLLLPRAVGLHLGKAQTELQEQAKADLIAN